jgi:hypothetical protein
MKFIEVTYTDFVSQKSYNCLVNVNWISEIYQTDDGKARIRFSPCMEFDKKQSGHSITTHESYKEIRTWLQDIIHN